MWAASTANLSSFAVVVQIYLRIRSARSILCTQTTRHVINGPMDFKNRWSVARKYVGRVAVAAKRYERQRCVVCSNVASKMFRSCSLLNQKILQDLWRIRYYRNVDLAVTTTNIEMCMVAGSYLFACKIERPSLFTAAFHETNVRCCNSVVAKLV